MVKLLKSKYGLLKGVLVLVIVNPSRVGVQTHLYVKLYVI